MINHKFIDYNGNKYLVKRIIKVSKLKPDFNQQDLKGWTQSDTLLKKDGYFYCCETLQEAEIISWDNQKGNVKQKP
tara:strand:- start:755 stop:982 length:228 start_codon:yes stop_codon:yes gene_type:complete